MYCFQLIYENLIFPNFLTINIFQIKFIGLFIIKVIAFGHALLTAILILEIFKISSANNSRNFDN